MDRQTARAGLVHRLNHKLHVGRVVDLEVQAGVPPSGPAENVEDGLHAATPASSSASVACGASLASANVIAKNAVSGALCVSGCMDDKAVVRFQLGNPVLDVSGGVAVGVLVGDARDGAKEGRSHLGD